MEKKKETVKRPIAKFVTRCYLWFWAGLVLTLIVALLTDMTSPAVTVCSTLTAWTPTVVLLATFKKLLPEQNLKQWLKERFSAKINILFIVLPFVSVFIIGFGALLITEGMDAERFRTIFTPSTIAATAFSSLVSGALGEELGWRGYLQPAIEEKNGGKVIKSALIVGLIWSFWHTPLWFVTVGLPWNILPFYIIGFITANISFALIIAVSYAHCKNIVIPMWIHFCFNFISNIIISGFDLTVEQGGMVKWFCVLAALSIVLAVCFAVGHILAKRGDSEIRE